MRKTKSAQKTGCDVIVTYCWNRVGYNILRNLTAHGLSVWTADTSSRNICSMSRFCAGSFTYPDPFTHEDEFISTLVSMVGRLRPSVLLPTHDEGIIISRHRHRFPEWLTIPVAPAELLVRLSNKRTATEIAARAGVPVPKVFGSADEIASYPVVFKTSVGNSAKGVFFPRDRKTLDELRTRFVGTDVLIEEKIGGSDVCVDCLRYGDFFASSVYRAIVTKTDGGGTTTQREIVDMPELESYARKLLDSVGYNGVCGLDFRVDHESGRIAFIEVNARYTGGLATPIAAGFEIPYMHYLLATGKKTDDVPRAIAGTRTKWVLGDIITLVGRILSMRIDKSELRQVLRFSGFDAFDDYRRDDRRAIVGEMVYYLAKLIKNGKLNP